MPRPGTAVSLAMTVRLRLPWRTSSSIKRSGDPTPIKPPIMSDAPSGIILTALSTETAFMVRHPCLFQQLLMRTRSMGRKVSEHTPKDKVLYLGTISNDLPILEFDRTGTALATYRCQREPAAINSDSSDLKRVIGAARSETELAHDY